MSGMSGIRSRSELLIYSSPLVGPCVIRYAPIYLAAIAGAWWIIRRTDTRFLGVALLATVAAFVGSTARLYMFWGGSSAPARFLVPLLPCLAPLIALALTHAKQAVSRSLVGLWLAISVAVAVGAVIRPASSRDCGQRAEFQRCGA